MNELDIALAQAIDAAWERHAQHVTLHVPTGCYSRREVRGGEVIGRLSFNLAVHEVVEQIQQGVKP